MTALNDAERAEPAKGEGRALPARVGSALERTGKSLPTWLPSRRFIYAVVAIGGMQLLATMDSTIAIVALPQIQDELALSDAGRSWVITAYVLTFGGLMLLGGRLGDTIGRKRTFIVGVALFTIASILCGIAWDEATLVVARLLQGVGAAIASPTGLALVATTFPRGGAQRRHRGVRGDDRYRLGDGPGGRRRAHRGVLAVGVPGQRADRRAGDLPGPRDAARDAARADEAGCRRCAAGDARL